MPPHAKRQLGAKTEIDGFRLIWRLHREQHTNGLDDWHGLAIHVQNETRARRDLYLEYPLAPTLNKNGITRTDTMRVPIHEKKVEAHIRQAIAAGWDPESRGRPFVFEVEELPS
jgi:hypothetical protein